MRTAKAHLRSVGSAGKESAEEYASKYQILFDQASDAILTLSASGEIDAANQAVEEMTGYHKTELVGSQIAMLVPPKSKISAQHRAKPLSAELFRTPGTYEDVAMMRKDGYIRYVDVSVTHVKPGKESLAVALFRDLTEKKRMERELITKHTELRDAYIQLEKKNVELQSMQDTLVQSGKMAALGELAAGIAHELNQPLQGIRGYAQELQHLAVGQPNAGHTTRGESEIAVKEIISNVDKMAAIIGYLRTFTRKSTENHELTDIHHAIEEALKMLKRQFAARGIQVERQFASDVPKVYANPLQLEQVFINLATNARDAIEATGRGNGQIWIKTRKAGEFAEVEFRDNGCGIDGRVKQKVFNPFFTTKEVGKGMGLGLSLSYGILSKLHGSIVVESEIGKGAAFTVRIPKDFRELA
jgi:PAS domain S-box-containing protein